MLPALLRIETFSCLCKCRHRHIGETRSRIEDRVVQVGASLLFVSGVNGEI